MFQGGDGGVAVISLHPGFSVVLFLSLFTFNISGGLSGGAIAGIVIVILLVIIVVPVIILFTRGLLPRPKPKAEHEAQESGSPMATFLNGGKLNFHLYIASDTYACAVMNYECRLITQSKQL